MSDRLELIAAGLCLVVVVVYILDEVTGGLMARGVLILAGLGIVCLLMMVLFRRE